MAMMTPEVRISVLESRFASMEKSQADMAEDVKTLVALMNQSKGSWKIVAGIAGFSGAIGALLAKIGITFGGIG